MTFQDKTKVKQFTNIIAEAIGAGPEVFNRTLDALPEHPEGIMRKYMTAAATYTSLEFQIYKILHDAGLTVESIKAFKFAVDSIVLGAEYGDNPASGDFIRKIYSSANQTLQLEDILKNVDERRENGEIGKSSPEQKKLSELLSAFNTSVNEYLKDKESRNG